jgi:hypothetical protein
LRRGKYGDFGEFGSGGKTFIGATDYRGAEIRIIRQERYVIAELSERPAIESRESIGRGEFKEKNFVANYNVQGSELVWQMLRER